MIELLRRDGFDCGICGISLGEKGGRLQIDHVTQVHEGGSHTLENVRLTHATCNLSRLKVAA
jgi:5-methylcytosine-specific restriction endonuclease McrA